MTGLARAALIRVAITAMALSEGADAGRAARTLLAKMTVPLWAAFTGLSVWHDLPGTGPDVGVMLVTGALAITGTIIAAVRHTNADPVHRLLNALIAADEAELASRERGCVLPLLRPVRPAASSDGGADRPEAL